MLVNRGPDPGPFSKHGDYKPDLRRIFQERCAYCLTPDDKNGGLAGMTVDHHRCVTSYPHLRLTWTNLYYSCIVCNSHYKKDFPTSEEEAKGDRFVDVCAEDSDKHFRFTRDRKTRALCRVKALTRAGRFTLRVLRFNDRPSLREFWLELHDEEQVAVRQLQDVKLTIRDAKAILRRGDNSTEIRAILERAHAQRRELSDRLSLINSRRPFPAN
jgi:uncharacterized protein (TIGR02646 family)